MSEDLPKIDLTLLKKLVSELENSLGHTQEISTENVEDKHRFMAELFKSVGLAAGIAQEAGALMRDMYQLSRLAQQSVVADGQDLLEELFGKLTPYNKNDN